MESIVVHTGFLYLCLKCGDCFPTPIYIKSSLSKRKPNSRSSHTATAVEQGSPFLCHKTQDKKNTDTHTRGVCVVRK